MARQKRKVKKLRGRGFLRQHFPQVKEVEDAVKGVVVTVRQRDNVDGRKNQPTECAMARAMKREFNADGVIIGLSTSYIIKGEKAIRYETPESVGREITSFDRHHDFAPGEYGLGPVSPSRRSDTEKRPRGSGTDTRKSRIVHKETVRVRTLK